LLAPSSGREDLAAQDGGTLNSRENETQSPALRKWRRALSALHRTSTESEKFYSGGRRGRLRTAGRDVGLSSEPNDGEGL